MPSRGRYPSMAIVGSWAPAPEGVAHVRGMNCHPCVRNGPSYSLDPYKRGSDTNPYCPSRLMYTPRAMNRKFGRVSCVCAVVLAGALSGCGGGSEGLSPVSTSPTAPTEPTQPLPQAPLTPSGQNWSFRTDGGLNRLDGSFDASGDAVTAVLSPSGSPSCFQTDSDRALFTGTRAGRVIQMRSRPLRDQVIDLSGTLSANGEAFEGAYTITGGCSGGATGAMAGRAVNLTGVWSGKLGNVPAVVDMQMASTPDGSAGTKCPAR